MMINIDFNKLIDSTRFAWSHDAADVLAAKVPELCPDCDSNGWTVADIGNGDAVGLQCDHPNSPTIARILAIGAAGWEIWHRADGEFRTYGDVYNSIKNAMREAPVREVKS